MPRSISPQLKARLALGNPTAARLWTVTRKDGVVHRYTSHDRPIVKPSSPTETFLPTDQFKVSAIQMSVQTGIQNCTVAIAYADDASPPPSGITGADLLSGLYDGANFAEELIDWQFPEYGTVILMTGTFGPVQKNNRGEALFELEGLMSRLRRYLGESYSMECRADLGDARCTVDIEALKATGVVTGATNPGRILVTIAISPMQESGWFTMGHIHWTSGVNNDIWMEVLNDTALSPIEDRNLLLAVPMPQLPQAGDTFDLYPGCDKRRATCIEKFDNVVNFRGEDVMSGSTAQTVT